MRRTGTLALSAFAVLLVSWMRCALLLLLLVVATGPAQGDNSHARARVHFDIATQQYRARNYDDASREFLAAYAAWPDPAFLWNVALCYRKLDDLPRTREVLKTYLARAPVDAPERPRALALQAEIGDGSEPPPSPRRVAPKPSPAIQAPPAAPPPDAVSPPAASEVQPPARAPAPTKAPERKPVYRRASFWVPMAVIVVGAAVGIGLGVTYGSPREQTFQVRLP
jgi:hypothetical protein